MQQLGTIHDVVLRDELTDELLYLLLRDLLHSQPPCFCLAIRGDREEDTGLLLRSAAQFLLMMPLNMYVFVCLYQCVSVCLHSRSVDVCLPV